MAEMFGHPTWRKNAIIGLLLGVSGMIGLWGIGFFSPELISEALKGEKQEVIDQVRGRGTILFDIGAFLGMSAFTFVAALVSRAWHFWSFNSFHGGHHFVFQPELARCLLDASHDGFRSAIPFCRLLFTSPALPHTIAVPSRFLLQHGTVSCRPAPILLAYLSTPQLPRGASLMACVYIFGIVALIWAPKPKTKNYPSKTKTSS